MYLFLTIGIQCQHSTGDEEGGSARSPAPADGNRPSGVFTVQLCILNGPAPALSGKVFFARDERQRRLQQREPEGLGGGKGKGRTEKREKKKHAAPEGDSLCFAVACVDRNQMVSWNTRLAIRGAKHMVNGREK